MATWEEVKVEKWEVSVRQPITKVWANLLPVAHITVAAALQIHVASTQFVPNNVTPYTPGSLCILHLTPYSTLSKHGFSSATVKYEEVDSTRLFVKVRLVGGGALGNLWHSLQHSIQVVPDPSYPHDYALVHHTLEFQRIGAHQFHLCYKEATTQVTHDLETQVTPKPTNPSASTNLVIASV